MSTVPKPADPPSRPPSSPAGTGPPNRFDPALIRHRAPGVLGELEILTARLVETADAMAAQLDAALANVRSA